MASSDATSVPGAPSPLPTEQEYRAVYHQVGAAHGAVEKLGLRLREARDNGRTHPATFEDIGRLYAFVEAVGSDAEHLGDLHSELKELLSDLDCLRGEAAIKAERAAQDA